MIDDDGLIAAYLLDGNGGGEEIDWQAVHDWKPDVGTLWVHLDRNAPSAVAWINEASGLDTLTAEALLAEETRPRVFSEPRGMMVILRGVNLNPGANPEDMVGLRIWLEDHRIISVRYRRLMAVRDLRDRVDQGHGPRGPGDFLATIADRLGERMGPVIHDLGERLDALDLGLSEMEANVVRSELRGIRHAAIALRRYLSPQRDVLSRLQMEQSSWLSPANKLELREIADRTIRFVEELDEIRERALVLQDELITRLSEAMQKTMYILTVVAAVILPLSFVTGLLGVNVGGIPGDKTDNAFFILCGLLVVISVFEVWLFRKMKWI